MALPFPWVRALLAGWRLTPPRASLVETCLGDERTQRHFKSGIAAYRQKFVSAPGSDLKSDLEELAYALLIGAMTRKERANPFGVPRVGHSVDRRTLLHLGETFQEDKVKCLMCFVCGCKHLFHYGYDKFGREVSKGDIDYMQRGEQGDLFNLLHGGQDGKALGRAFEVNLSRKKFKRRYGAAVANDESFANDTWEWKRLTVRSGQLQEVMCNPEDVIP